MPPPSETHVTNDQRTPLSRASTVKPTSSGLPADLVQAGARRVGYACLFYSAAFFFAYGGPTLAELIRKGALPEHFLGFRSLIALGAILAALALFFLSRSGRIRPGRLLDIGLVFEVIGAFGIAMTSVYGSFPVWSVEVAGTTTDLQGLLNQQVGYMGIPWECVWIVMFSLLAPNSPRKVLFASLAAATMGPCVLAISKATGATSPETPWSWLLSYYLFSTYLCALLAYIGSRWIRRYAIHIKKAREIGQYRMVKLLGKGGMGEVWRARHRMLARPAAIKLIRAEALGGDDASRLAVLRRFEREAQATARLGSTHTISVYDFGVTEDGTFYYVMELLDGMDLNTLVKRFGPVSAGRTISLLRQACHSLVDAHESGMVHRDIKPANLYVCRLGPDFDFVKVLDFGLVKAHQVGGQEATQLTQKGVTFGTPGFMAPEIAMGAETIDGRADLYALACVGYWLLTGEAVFEGDTPLATVLHHVKTEPVPPSQRSEIEIPSDLEKIILTCLAKEPAGRPQSAQELDQLLADCKPTHQWTPEQAAEWWTLHVPEASTEDTEEIDSAGQELIGEVPTS